MARSGRHKPAPRRRRRKSRRRGLAAIGTGVAAIAGGVFALLPHHPTTGIVATSCGIVSCTATMPAPAIASIAASPGATPRRTPKPRHTGKPKPHRAHSPSPRPTAPSNPPTTQAPAPPPPPPPVAVTYSVVQRSSGGFEGRFVITNNSGSVLDGWRLTASFPGDDVMSGSGSAYQLNGSSITFDQALLQGPIGPGSSLALTVNVSGSNTSPGNCTLNGSACAS
jgi:Cellulose binding domain